MGLSRGGLASSLSIHLQPQFKRRSFGFRLQRWYASASKCKHKHKHKARLWLSERGLTLPSSGPAYGRPLKSNVRPRKKPHHESTVVVRFTARAITRNSGCCRRITTEALRQGSLVPSSSSVERPSRLRGVRPVASARKQARRARTLAHLPSGHKAKIQVGLAQSRPSSSNPKHSPSPKCKVISGAGHAARPASLDMLRHPNESTNTKHGGGSPSVA
jgi:hypothetical protein